MNYNYSVVYYYVHCHNLCAIGSLKLFTQVESY